MPQVSKGQDFKLFGSSVGVGSAASPITMSYANQTAGYLGMKLVNYAASGNGMWKEQNNAFTNMPQTGNNSMVLIEPAYNDMRADGASEKNVNMVMNCLRGIIANCFLKTAVAASEATLSGTYSATFVSSIVGGKANRINTAHRGVILQASGSFVEWSFTGDNVVVGFIGTDGVVNDHSSFQVFIDGYLREVINPNDYATGVPLSTWNHQYCPGSLVFCNLVGSSHTIKIVSLDNKDFIIDYFGTMKDPAICKPVIVAHVMKMTAAGYALLPYNKGSDAAVNAFNNEINGLPSTFCGYPLGIAETGLFYDHVLGVSGDKIHLNNTGHTQKANAFKSQITLGPGDDMTGWTDIILSGASMVNNGVNWKTTGTNNNYGNLGFGDLYLPAYTNGRIGVQYIDTEQRLHILGTSYQNTPVGKAGIKFGLYFNSTGLIIKVQNGATINTNIQAIAGVRYYIDFTGEDVTLLSSVDNEHFELVSTFTVDRDESQPVYIPADFYGSATKQMNNPIAFNFINI